MSTKKHTTRSSLKQLLTPLKYHLIKTLYPTNTSKKKQRIWLNKTEIITQEKVYLKKEISAVIKEMKLQIKDQIYDVLLEMTPLQRQSEAQAMNTMKEFKQKNKIIKKTMINIYHGLRK